MENKSFILPDLNLGKIENIWTKDKNYRFYNEGLLLKNLYIKTDKYTIGIHINRDNYYLYTVRTSIDEKKRLSLLDKFHRLLFIGGSKRILTCLSLYTSSPKKDYIELADINMFNLLLEEEINVPNIDKGGLFYQVSSSYKIFHLFNVVTLNDMNGTEYAFRKPSSISINFKLNRKYKKVLEMIENSTQKN